MELYVRFRVRSEEECMQLIESLFKNPNGEVKEFFYSNMKKMQGDEGISDLAQGDVQESYKDFVGEQTEQEERLKQEKQPEQESYDYPVGEQTEQEEQMEQEQQPEQESYDYLVGEQTEQEERLEQEKQPEQESYDYPVGEQTEQEEQMEQEQQPEHYEDSNSNTATQEVAVDVEGTDVTDQDIKSELNELAKKAKSFEDFVEIVADWLRLERQKEFFKVLIQIASSEERPTWNQIEQDFKLEALDREYSEWKKICTGKIVKEKTGYTLLKFVKILIKYKVGFEKEGKIEPFDLQPLNTEIVKFKKALKEVDRDSPIEIRIKPILEAMGLKEQTPRDEQLILNFISSAMQKNLGGKSFSDIATEIGVHPSDILDTQMTVSKLVNQFMWTYANQKMRVMEFLQKIQLAVM